MAYGDLIEPLLADLNASCPNVGLDIRLEDAFTDIVGEGLGIGVRLEILSIWRPWPSRSGRRCARSRSPLQPTSQPTGGRSIRVTCTPPLHQLASASGPAPV